MIFVPSEPADNLLVRLFKWSSREGRKPLENYCTEALVWCLNSSLSFRVAFLEGCGLKAFTASASGIRVRSQETIAAKTGTKYLDIILDREGDDSCCFVIECKVDDPLRNDQLEVYSEWLRGHPAKSKRMISLTKRASRKDQISVEHTDIYWRNTVRMLLAVAEPDVRIKFVLETFAEFLKEHGMIGFELSRIEALEVPFFQRALRVLQEFEDFLIQFRNLNQQSEAVPELLRPNETNGDTAYWKGVCTKSRNLWIGFGVSMYPDRPEIFAWVEVTLNSADGQLFQKLPAALKIANEEAETLRKRIDQGRFSEREGEKYFAFKHSLTSDLNGDGEHVAEWLLETAKSAVNLAGRRFSP